MMRKTTTSAGSVTINTERMNQLRQELKRNAGTVAHVGILGNTNTRVTSAFDTSKQGEPGNADIGLVHEYGSPTNRIPERSFLRMPLLQFLAPAIYAMGKEKWRVLILEKGLVVALKQLALLGENVVQDAFETGGFGLWAALKRATIRRKGSSAILIDTAQMRQAITSRIVVSATPVK